MREIKFRAWTKKKEMQYNIVPFQWDYVIDKMWHKCIESNGSDILGSGGTEAKFEVGGFAIEEKNIMQYTGLKDKNGKEIYEGDIQLWKFNHYIRYYIAYWSDFDCGFKWKLFKHNQTQETDPPSIPFDTEADYYDYVINSNQRSSFSCDQFSEIIGNKFENPEFLK